MRQFQLSASVRSQILSSLGGSNSALLDAERDPVTIAKRRNNPSAMKLFGVLELSSLAGVPGDVGIPDQAIDGTGQRDHRNSTVVAGIAGRHVRSPHLKV